MTQSFNLIDQPWIPCETFDGRVEEFSLRGALAYAHELRGISAETPLETASLYRLLLAVLHRVFGPASTGAWFDLWRAGAWDAARLDAYWEQWYDRFDLLHPDEDKRFYQRKPLEGKSTPIIHLVHSTGDNPALFSHVTNANHPGMTFAEAARSLVVAQAFRVGGLLKPGLSGPDSPAARGIHFLAMGTSLFHTSLLNMWSYTDPNIAQIIGIPQTQQDAPAWEQDDPIGRGRKIPAGYLDYLTWQSYRVWLEPRSDCNRIDDIEVGLGQPKLAPTVFDPFKHHRAVKKSSTNASGYTPLRFREERALWRDSSAILEQSVSSQGQADRPPMCIAWLATLYRDGLFDDHWQVPLLALGMASDQAKIEFYRQEELPIPARYFADPGLVRWLKVGLEQAEVIRQALSRALYRLAEHMIAPDAGKAEGRKPKSKDVWPLVKHWNVESQYWGAIEPAFWRLVEGLPRHGEAALVDWYRVLIQTARQAYESAEDLAGSDVRALKAAAAGRRTLEWNLTPIRKEIEQWQIE